MPTSVTSTTAQLFANVQKSPMVVFAIDLKFKCSTSKLCLIKNLAYNNDDYLTNIHAIKVILSFTAVLDTKVCIKLICVMIALC